jgi:hypothetical protein
MIHFDEATHSYTDDQGRRYLSVTQLLERVFPFDREGIAAKVVANPNSQYYGREVADVLAEWAAAADRGSAVHGAIEGFIKAGQDPSDPGLLPLVAQFKELPLCGELLSEERVWDEELFLAGTVDLIERRDGECVVWDIKTSKSISGDTHLKYSMQLEIYRRMVATRFGMPARIGGILWFEDYVRRGAHSRLQTKEHCPCTRHVESLLRARADEVEGL